jgi:CubicO group peptidase (beta-lactamase class C family)
VRLLSPRLVAYVSRNHTGDRSDDVMGGIPMHRGLGTTGAPETVGHGGAGTSYSWADPTSGVSFSYISNYMAPDPWHTMRLDRIANLVHAAID